MKQNKKEEEPLPALISSSLALLLSFSLPSISYSSLQTLMHSIILKRKSEQVINQMSNHLKGLYEKKIEGFFINFSSIKILFSDLLFYEKGILALFGNLEKSAKKEGSLSKVLFETLKNKMDLISEALFNEIGIEIESWRKGGRREEEGGWINQMMVRKIKFTKTCNIHTCIRNKKKKTKQNIFLKSICAFKFYNYSLLVL